MRVGADGATGGVKGEGAQDTREQGGGPQPTVGVEGEAASWHVKDDAAAGKVLVLVPGDERRQASLGQGGRAEAAPGVPGFAMAKGMRESLAVRFGMIKGRAADDEAPRLGAIPDSPDQSDAELAPPCGVAMAGRVGDGGQGGFPGVVRRSLPGGCVRSGRIGGVNCIELANLQVFWAATPQAVLKAHEGNMPPPCIGAAARVVEQQGFAPTGAGKMERLLATGATRVIDSVATPRRGQMVLEMTRGGAHKVVNTIGLGALGQSLTAACHGGEGAMVGLCPGDAEPLDPALLNGKATVIRGISVGSASMYHDLAEVMDMHAIRPVIGARFGFGRVRDASAAQASDLFGRSLSSSRSRRTILAVT